MSAHSAVKDRDNAMTSSTIPIGLSDLFGLEVASFQTYQPPSDDQNALRLDDGTTLPVHVFAEWLHPTTGQVLAKWDRDFLKGSAAATERTLGKGKAVYYGSIFNLEAARYLMRRYAAELGLKRLLPDVPEEIEVVCRTKDTTDFYFLLNHSNTPTRVNPGEGFVDLLTGDAPGSFSLAPFDYRVLKRAKGGQLLPK